MIGGILRDLKTMAVETGTIIFLIAHTKKIYQDEELDLSSIRDSSLISQEADYVFLIERLKKDKPKVKKKLASVIDKSGTEWTNTAKVTLAKNRRTGIMVYRKFEVVNHKFIEEQNQDEDT